MKLFAHKKSSTPAGDVIVADAAERTNEVHSHKRRFLKLLGLAGIGVGAATLLPHQASAATEGAPRLTDAVKLKDSSDVQVDIETQGTLDSIKTATEGTKTAADSIKTNTDTLVTNSNKFNFTGDNLNISQEGSDVFQVVDAQDTRVNPWTDDSVAMLRRLVKVMESHATADTVQRQRVTIDAFNTDTGAVADTGTLNVDDLQTSTTLTDSTKASTWLDNAWAYYAVAITAGTGSGQIRMIASSTITTLTLAAAWGVTPDSTSTYEIRNMPSRVVSYGICTNANANLGTFFDDTKVMTQWNTGTYVMRIEQANAPEQIRLITSAASTFVTFGTTIGWTPYIDPTTALYSGTVSLFLAPGQLVDYTQSWAASALVNKLVKITGGTGAGQVRCITSNTSQILTLEMPWTVIPDSTSTYSIHPVYTLPQYQISDVPILFSDVGTATGVARMVSATDSTVGTVTNIASVATIGSYPYQQMHADKAHEVYQDAIRSQLTFS